MVRHRPASRVLAASVAVLTAATGSAQRAPAPASSVLRIGLLAPTKGPRQAEGAELRRGAELAIEEANRSARGGVRFELIVRSDEGPWGGGSRQVVRLAFTDHVLGLVGAVESESAHLIEQVAQKARLVYLMPWTGDRSLTQTGVPWVFSCVPNDEQRARLLLRDLSAAGRPARVGLVWTADRSSRLAARSFAKVAAKSGHPIPASYGWEIADARPGGLDPVAAAAGAVAKAGPGAVVLLAPFSDAPRIARALGKLLPGVHVAVPSMPSAPGHPFYRRYRARYGHAASLPAAFAYDAVSLLARALGSLGADNRRDRDALRSVVARADYRGASGRIRFDRRGNRVMPNDPPVR